MPIFVGAGTSSFAKGSGGVGFSQITTTQRNALRDGHDASNSTLPTDGAIIYNTVTNRLEVRISGAWYGIGTVV